MAGYCHVCHCIVSGKAQENSRYLDDPVMPQEEEEKKAAEAWFFLPLREVLVCLLLQPMLKPENMLFQHETQTIPKLMQGSDKQYQQQLERVAGEVCFVQGSQTC